MRLLRRGTLRGGGLRGGRFGGEGGGNGFAPSVRAEGVDVLVLRELDGLHDGLAEVGEGRGGLAVGLALGDGSEEAGRGSGEVAGGNVACGKEIRDFPADFLASPGLGFFAGVEVAEMGLRGMARPAAAAAIGKRE